MSHVCCNPEPLVFVIGWACRRPEHVHDAVHDRYVTAVCQPLLLCFAFHTLSRAPLRCAAHVSRVNLFAAPATASPTRLLCGGRFCGDKEGCSAAGVCVAVTKAPSTAPTVNVPCSGQAAADTVASMFIKAMVDAGKAMDLLPQLPGGATGECGTCITTKMGSPKSVAAECLGKHLGSVATAVPTFRFLAARTLRPSTAAAQVCTGGDTGLCRSAGRGSVHRGQHAIIEQRSS
jgi:hypothetical protein